MCTLNQSNQCYDFFSVDSEQSDWFIFTRGISQKIAEIFYGHYMCDSTSYTINIGIVWVNLYIHCTHPFLVKKW